jgi:predicted transcriptional regulator YdeE
MDKINVTHLEIKLAGIKIRTNNKAEVIQDKAKIGPMVQTYFQDEIAKQILDKATPGITYIIYTDYESDYTGEYTCFIGEAVNNFNNISENLFTHIIPAQNYAKFTTETGALPKIVIEAWTEIWQMKELDSNRSYLSDFEVYDSRAADPSNAILDIYVGVKS